MSQCTQPEVHTFPVSVHWQSSPGPGRSVLHLEVSHLVTWIQVINSVAWVLPYQTVPASLEFLYWVESHSKESRRRKKRVRLESCGKGFVFFTGILAKLNAISYQSLLPSVQHPPPTSPLAIQVPRFMSGSPFYPNLFIQTWVSWRTRLRTKEQRKTSL